MSRIARVALVVLVGVTAGNGCSCGGPRVAIDFVVPEGGEQFLDTPWPSDVLVTADGLDLNTFPNPYGSDTLYSVLSLFQTAKSYSSVQTMYFHVDGGVDEKTLPQSPKESLTSDAMFLVERETLKRIPIEWKSYPKGTSFLPKGTVAVVPLLGAVPRGPTALVVTSAAAAKNGDALGPSADLLALATCEKLSKKRAPKCDAYQKLVSDLKLAPEDVALIQFVDVEDPTRSLRDARDVLLELPTPEAFDITVRPDDAYEDYLVYDGVVPLAQFQAGRPPYDTLDGTSGGFVIGADGRPEVQRTEDVQFVLTVPKAPMPPGGWPIAINGHGTGGDLESGLGNGAGDTAWQLAQVGTAMLAVSEPLHRTRRGYSQGQEEILTFNFFNPLAGRDNWRQSALEKVQLVSVARALVVDVDQKGPASSIHFDRAHVSYFGHSQGGIVGALFVAIEDRIAGAFLSGAGAGFGPSLVEKVDPVKISDVLKTVLLMPDEDEVDRFHPVISLLQSWVDPSDPIHYGRLWRHKHGHVPHLIVTSGLLDTFTPPSVHEGLAGSFELPLAEPVKKDMVVLDVLGIEPTDCTVEGNLETADGEPLTGAVFQYEDQGHFAVFDDAGAQSAMRGFFGSLRTGVPHVVHE